MTKFHDLKIFDKQITKFKEHDNFVFNVYIILIYVLLKEAKHKNRNKVNTYGNLYSLHTIRGLGAKVVSDYTRSVLKDMLATVARWTNNRRALSRWVTNRVGNKRTKTGTASIYQIYVSSGQEAPISFSLSFLLIFFYLFFIEWLSRES